MVIVVPVPVRLSAMALPLEAERPESEMGEEVFVVLADIWNVATPICPSGTSTVLEVMSIIRQDTWPDPVLHDRTSPAPIAIALTATVTELKSVLE
jgi:hypothetical protein